MKDDSFMISGALETISCPNCRSNEATPWARENGYLALKCAPCGLVYVNPRPREEAISEANKIGVHQGDHALNIKTRRKPSKVPYYSKILRDVFSKEISEGKPLKWLDVGAGYGEFIEAVMATMPVGTKTIGVEPMAPKVKVARDLGLPIDSRDIEDAGEDFDVISLINVYSHIPDFDGFASMLAKKIKPGGVMFVETGNLAALSRDEFSDMLYLPDHLVFSSLAQMEQTFARLGMDLETHKGLAIDNTLWCLKLFAKELLKGRIVIRLPGTSSFRTMFYKARLRR